MSEPTLALLDVDKIDIEEGFNARTDFDEKKMTELVASVTQAGVVQPLLVKPGTNGRHFLVAGERRLIAARKAGLKRVSALIGDEKHAAVQAAVENLVRADLNPIEAARSLQTLREAENLGTNKKLAERTGKKVEFVNSRLRLLKLPAEVQVYIANGTVPIDAERTLREIAKVSPRVAECACELVRRGDLETGELLRNPVRVLYAVAQSEFKKPPTMISIYGARLREVITDEAKSNELIAQLQEWGGDEDPYLNFSESGVDAARAAGCLLEVEARPGRYGSRIGFITDRELAADLLERNVEKLIRDAQKEEKERQAEEAKATSAADSKKPAPKAKSAYQQRMEAKKKAESHNEAIGVKLVKRRGAAARKRHGLKRAKAIAAVLLDDHPDIAAAGLRLTLPQLQETKQKTLKSGDLRHEIHYVGVEEANEYLAKKIADARSESEVYELLTEAMIAAAFADPNAVPQTQRKYWDAPGCADAIALLSTEVKAVLPPKASESK